MWITGIVIVVLFLVYVIIAYVRCGEFNAFCLNPREDYFQKYINQSDRMLYQLINRIILFDLNYETMCKYYIHLIIKFLLN